MNAIQEAIVIYSLLGTVQGILIGLLWAYRPGGPKQTQ